FPAAPLFLFMHGKDITIPKGTEITAYINGDIPLDPKRFVSQMTATPEAGAAPGQPTASATAAQNASAADPALSTVDLKSTPDGAEITVDEKFTVAPALTVIVLSQVLKPDFSSLILCSPAASLNDEAVLPMNFSSTVISAPSGVVL